MKILVQGPLHAEVPFNFRFYSAHALSGVHANGRSYKIRLRESEVPTSFGITVHPLGAPHFAPQGPVTVRLKLGVRSGHLRYYNGTTWVEDREQTVRDGVLDAVVRLDQWTNKCRFFVAGFEDREFVVHRFDIEGVCSPPQLLFTAGDAEQRRNHYSLVKSHMLYEELRRIFVKSDVRLLAKGKDPIDFSTSKSRHIDIGNITTTKDILFVFVTNPEYYETMLCNPYLKNGIESGLRVVFRACTAPPANQAPSGHNSLFLLQSGSMKVPEFIARPYGVTTMTIDEYLARSPARPRSLVSTMGVSSTISYREHRYDDGRIHLLYMGRLTRTWNLPGFINALDNLLDRTKFAIDVLPGTLEVIGGGGKRTKLNPIREADFMRIAALFNKTINVMPCVDQSKVADYIMKADIGIDFPSHDDPSRLRKGPENCKLYEYLSLGLPTVSQVTSNSHLIPKYSCGTELEGPRSPESYHSAIMDIAASIGSRDRSSVSRAFCNDFNYRTLTLKDVRRVLFYYRHLPMELLGTWNVPEEKLLSASPRLKGHKFFDRERSIKSNFERLLKHFPDLFQDKTKRVLDLSCGNGATMEILRFLGHEVEGVDYESQSHALAAATFDSRPEMDNDWPYKVLLESQGLCFRGHDLNVLPYPFEDNSFDIVNSWGAIEFYGRPSHWGVFILEMLRISREYVNVAFNGVSSFLEADEEYTQEYSAFFRDIEDHFPPGIVRIERVSERHFRFLKQPGACAAHFDRVGFSADELVSIGDPFLKKVDVVYAPQHVSCERVGPEHVVTIKGPGDLPDNSGISLVFYKNASLCTLVFEARKVGECECYLRVYTGKKWIELEDQLDAEYKKYSITAEFDFNAVSKWRIGFRVSAKDEAEPQLRLRYVRITEAPSR